MHLPAGHHGPVRPGETSVPASASQGAGAAVAGPIPTSIRLLPTRGSAEASLTTRTIAPTTRPDEKSPAIPVMRRDAAATGQQALGNIVDGARSIAGSALVGQDRSLFWSAPNDASPIVPMSSGVHGTVPATSGIGPSQSATAQSSASVTWQIGQAMGTGPTTETVLKLEPEELGRVTLNLRGDERSMVLVVQAERLETLDLIRRSSQELASALSDLGYNDITFEFGGSGDHATHEGSHAGPKGGNGPDGPQDEEQATSSPGNRPGTGHVDIRI